MKHGVRYFRDSDGHYLAVTDETPRGPLRGFVFVGRRLVGDTVSEEAFGIDQLAKWARLDIGDVPTRCLEALGYDEPKVEEVEIVEEVEELPQDDPEQELDVFVVTRSRCPEAHYGGCVLLFVLYVAAVALFAWARHS